ncbi:ATP synthase subunit I [Anaerorhabdus sp.]|uniref:ATP synthase subunit I n=1 Tax=Anaerorhabdus sp. TaxID=1872524 RepID=UPI002FCB07D0
MNIEIKSTIKPTMVLSGIIMVVGLFFNYRFSLGVLLGTSVSVLHLMRLERNITQGLDSKKKLGGWIFMFLTDLIMLAIPLMLAVMLPQIFDLIGAAVGLLLNKFVIYGMNIRRKES